MRPVRLELRGFTAFRDPQTLEFANLDLFAISGATGSGKSSLLDAITYALFGYVERVGKQVGQLISQGQPRMAVTLEFDVGTEAFRIFRETRARAATKILLERWDGSAWRSAGEGADRVREADAMIHELIGLDYNGFTRSVLLPQGRFAEFLSGDAKERRAILTELLGLELFERLGRRAGDLKREADLEVRAKETVLAREYEGVTPDAVRGATQLVDDLTERDAALARAETTIRELAQRGAEAARSVKELRSTAEEAELAGAVAGGAAGALADLATELSGAERLAKEALKELGASEKAAERAKVALAKAEAEAGSARDLERLRAKAESAQDLRAELEEAETELKAARSSQPKLEKSLASSEQMLAVATADAEASILAMESAGKHLHDAEHADMAATLRSEVHEGGNCPVCGRVIERLPRGRRAPMLEKARAALAKAEAAAGTARNVLDGARSSREAMQRDVTDAARRCEVAEQNKAKVHKELEAISKQLATVLGPGTRDDPLRAVDRRLERLGELDDARDVTGEAAAEAKDAAVAAERERDAHVSRAAELRARLEGLPVTSISERARAAGGSDLEVDDLPPIGSERQPAGLGKTAAELADRLSTLVERLRELAERRSKTEAALLAEMHAAAEGLVDPADSPLRQVDAVAAARAAAAKQLAGAEHRAAELRTRLENVVKLNEEVAVQRARLVRFGALANELRADRVISFLQVEALRMLAAAGSERLAMLSSERYRLAFEDDEFFVVDTWNGEERRSVRTLSGGETFLASLALALALSEQVRSLSVSDRARLDSLFLDEGFGTLDPESLEVVVDAIEQLGGDGRMVGVITHVQELAIRLPARIEVEKSPRGSRLEVVAAD
jgi:DNA repair protein SbcC/Rad50